MLTSKCFIANSPDGESYRTGEIISQVSPAHYLVQFDTMDGTDFVMPMEVVGCEEMTAITCDDCGQRQWAFFHSRPAMQAHLDWLNEPAKKTKDLAKPLAH